MWRMAVAIVLIPSVLSAQGQPLSLVRERVIDAEFGGVGSGAVDRRGRIYATDFMAQHVVVFSGDGVRVDTIGREGRGPGEFAGLGAVVIGRGDTLFALDLALRRITAWPLGETHTSAYTLPIPMGKGQVLTNLLLAPASGFVVGYEEAYTAKAEINPVVSVRFLRPNRTLARDSLFATQRIEALVRRLPRGTSVGPLPYGRMPIYQSGPEDRVYWSWSNSVRVSAVGLEGTSAVIVDEKAPDLPVGQRDLDRLLSSFEDSDSVARGNLRDAIREGVLPRTKPAFRAMVVDDMGRIWVGRIGKEDHLVMRAGVLSYTSPTRTMTWEVLDGPRRATVSLPDDIELKVVRNGKAYGVRRDEDGVESIVVFAVRPGGR